MQTKEFDDRTRAALCIGINLVCNEKFPSLTDSYHYNKLSQEFIKHVRADVYAAEVDWSKVYDGGVVLNMLLETIRTDDYDDILTVIEYVVRRISSPNWGFWFDGKRYTATQYFNSVFEREYVGYRFVGLDIVPITDPVEIVAIEDALSVKNRDVSQHIEKAVGFIFDRESPDYANAIKESITAVERMCSIIVGRATTLSDALKNLSKAGVEIHPALKDAFNKLYAYTNDSSGIRHAGQLGGKDATFEEAKFMLVSCCAFVNYLTGVIAKIEK